MAALLDIGRLEIAKSIENFDDSFTVRTESMDGQNDIAQFRSADDPIAVRVVKSEHPVLLTFFRFTKFKLKIAFKFLISDQRSLSGTVPRESDATPITNSYTIN